MTSLTEAVNNIEAARVALEAHEKAAAERAAEIRLVIKVNREILSMSAEGLDREAVALAETVIYVQGQYARAGDDRASCISDAVKQLATGKPKGGYCDLWHQYFGTKTYDRWHGQRSDHAYGYGPRHGSNIFQVGLTKDARARDPRELTPAEIEAGIYYLTNIERIQDARTKAASGVAA